ncbi:MAG: hypothetical protein H6665_10790 [Ardenticatenaceae bacterium]|nr:hypothetical protein [Ardenticatenaceae bacterium]
MNQSKRGGHGKRPFLPHTRDRHLFKKDAEHFQKDAEHFQKDAEHFQKDAEHFQKDEHLSAKRCSSF